MNGTVDLPRLVLRVLFFLALGAGYTVVGWRTYSRWHLRGLSALWTLSSILYGYVSFRVVCSRPVTCDVGEPFSLHYLTHVGSLFAVVGAIGFAAASAVVFLRSRPADAGAFRAGDLLLGTVATVCGWTLGIMTVARLWSW